MPRLEVETRPAPPLPLNGPERFGWIPTDAPDCPPAHAIEHAVDRDLGLSETRSLVDHLSGCPSCFAAWRKARADRRGKLLRFPTSA